MASGIGILRRQAMLNWLTGQAAATSPSGTWSLGLWVGDPGEDGQSGAEVTGTGYQRGSLAAGATGWQAVTNIGAGVTAQISTNATVTFTSGTTGSWSSGSTITHVALWTTTGTSSANYIGRASITGIVIGPGITSVSIVTGFMAMRTSST